MPNNLNNSSERAQQGQAIEHKMEFKKFNNKWNILESRSKSKAALKAKKGERIAWVTSDSDLYFQFMDEDLFGQYTSMVKKGQSLNLVVSNKAKPGTYKYAVFHLGARQFIEGNSPPAIIIE